MNPNQKYGMTIIIISILATLLSLTISNGWASHLSLIDNLLNTLQVQLIEIKTKNSSSNPYITHNYHYLIDFPTKYAILFFTTTAAYGLTTYLSITKPPTKISSE